jgi:hypothetical protein
MAPSLQALSKSIHDLELLGVKLVLLKPFNPSSQPFDIRDRRQTFLVHSRLVTLDNIARRLRVGFVGYNGC